MITDINWKAVAKAMKNAGFSIFGMPIKPKLKELPVITVRVLNGKPIVPEDHNKISHCYGVKFETPVSTAAFLQVLHDAAKAGKLPICGIRNFFPAKSTEADNAQ